MTKAARPLLDQQLACEGGHTIAYARKGTEGATPCVFLHGGPGGRTTPHHIKLFEKLAFDAVFFDQRGCGLSTPHCGFAHNTTPALIADMERLRQKMGFERWLVVGGSWGATLALAYAKRHPERVTGLVLRSVFLGGAQDWADAFEVTPRLFRPELWDALKARTEERAKKKMRAADVIPAWGAWIADPARKEDCAAAWLWHDYERILSELKTEQTLPTWKEALGRASFPASPFLEWHYRRHDFFLEGSLLELHDLPQAVPLTVIAGRYDLLCPPRAAFALKEAWGAEARLVFAESAGHHAFHPTMYDALRKALTAYAKN